MNEKILVMMSTYNGEKYIDEQIDSVLAQKNVRVDLLIRDDGSKDETVRIIKRYCEKFDNIKFYEGPNLKPARSFLNLIETAELNYDYYAFCDQDDVWHEDKLYQAIEKIGKKKDSQKPILYYCGVETVDDNLKNIDTWFVPEECASSLSETLSTLGLLKGCTMVINKELMENLRKQFPKVLTMHDVYIHEVCLALNGVIIADQGRYMKYRVHRNNVTMGKVAIRKRFKKLMKMMFTEEKCKYSKMIEEIIHIYEEQISPENLEQLRKVAYYRKNLRTKLKLLKDEAGKAFVSKKWYVNVKLKVLLGIL